MFKKILIANRGEIACRVIKTARRLGIATVAVYSEADRNALHVRAADEAIQIGGPAAADSYLVMDKIIEACVATGAEAVHPGYGFLSERASFPQALAAKGIVFIGPNPKAIEAMGDKIQSKKYAQAAGVSVVPGFLGEIESPEEAARIADEIGYPVMIKASAGGGGKGMRVAHARDEVVEGFTRARSEAKSSFGDDRVFIEKFIVEPRHIEIQVLGDKHGNIIHLGERECSIQRRNQKVIEEAPSPLLDPATREKMGAEAVALAKAVGYDSAGTVEFVCGQDKQFYFLEMNTRLQVEHPVTELVTGLDLVEQMIRIAAGEKLELKQHDVTLRGWAVESRVYAEDPARNFLPSTGRLVTYRPPAEGVSDGITIRNDTGVYEGAEISIYYDPMIAKFITYGGSRQAAVEAQARSLDAFVIHGIRHNIPFLNNVMRHERFRAGKLSTQFLAEEYPQGFTPHAPKGDEVFALAAVAASIDHVLNQRKRHISTQLPAAKPVVFTHERSVFLGRDRYDIVVEPSVDGVSIHFVAENTTYFCHSLWHGGEVVWTGTINGELAAVQIQPIPNGFILSRGGAETEARVYTRREADLAELMPEKVKAEASKALLCPMPGLVRAIHVAPGQEVKAGDPLCVVEAMKMENLLRADQDATIKTVLAKEGDSLAVDAVIMEFA